MTEGLNERKNEHEQLGVRYVKKTFKITKDKTGRNHRHVEQVFTMNIYRKTKKHVIQPQGRSVVRQTHQVKKQVHTQKHRQTHIMSSGSKG